MLNFFQSSKQLPPERQYITHPSTTFPVPLYVILGSGIHENAFCKWKMCDFKYVKFIFELFFLEMLYVTQMIPPWFCTDLEPSSHCICGLNLNWIWVMVDELWQFPLLKNFVNEDLTRVWDKKTKKSILSLEIIKIGTLLYFSESYTSAELFLQNYVRRAPKSPSRLLGRPFNIPFKKKFRQEMAYHKTDITIEGPKSWHHDFI